MEEGLHDIDQNDTQQNGLFSIPPSMDLLSVILLNFIILLIVVEPSVIRLPVL
jgi:hypothetical protein